MADWLGSGEGLGIGDGWEGAVFVSATVDTQTKVSNTLENSCDTAVKASILVARLLDTEVKTSITRLLSADSEVSVSNTLTGIIDLRAAVSNNRESSVDTQAGISNTLLAVLDTRVVVKLTRPVHLAFDTLVAISHTRSSAIDTLTGIHTDRSAGVDTVAGIKIDQQFLADLQTKISNIRSEVADLQVTTSKPCVSQFYLGDVEKLTNAIMAKIASSIPTATQIATAVWESSTATTLTDQVVFLAQTLKNRRAIRKIGGVWQLVIFDIDNITPILAKPLQDFTGHQIADLANGVLAIEEMDEISGTPSTPVSRNIISTADMRTLVTEYYDSVLCTADVEAIADAMVISIEAAVPTVMQVADAVWADEAAVEMVDTILFLTRTLKNKREVKRVGSIWKLMVYDDDGITPILSKPLKDFTGSQIADLTGGILAIEGASNA